MKIEKFLIHYLLKYKELSLQGFGTFSLDAAIAEITDPTKPIVIPEGTISFIANPRAETDPTLIEFITENTGKIKSLAAADLDSYLNVCRQILNIGNPFVIENIGTLQKTPNGEMIYKSALQYADKLVPQKKIDNEESYQYENDMFKSLEKKSSKNGKTFLTLLFVVVIILISWAVWYYLISGNKDNAEIVPASELIVPVADSNSVYNSSKYTVATDSSSQAENSSFKIIINEYTDSAKAAERLQYLKTFRRNVILITTDSSRYKIAEISMRPLADTTKVLDSLKLYYGNEKLRLEY